MSNGNNTDPPQVPKKVSADGVQTELESIDDAIKRQEWLAAQGRTTGPFARAQYQPGGANTRDAE